VAQLVEALRYRPEGRGFHFRRGQPSDRTMPLGSTQTLPLTEMNARDISPFFSEGVKALVYTADELSAFVFRLSRTFGSVGFLEPKMPVHTLNGIACLVFYCLHPDM